MKLRKILTSTLVFIVCVAMLSTNVFAAAVTLTPGVDEDGKLKVTIGGDATGQVTFLATDASVALASVDGGDIQYIDQIDKTGDRIIAFAQRTGGEDLVNIYAGGENVTAYASVANVYVVAKAAVVDAAYTYECDAVAEEFESANLATFFTENDLVVNYRAVGSLASADAEEITYSASNAADFEFEIGEPTGSVYPVAVEYKGVAAGSVNVTAATPSPVVSIAITTLPEYDAVVWVDEGTDGDGETAAVLAAAKDVEIVVTATREDTTTFVVNNDNLTYDVNEVEGDLVVTVSYAGFEAAQTLSFTVREKAITSAIATINTGVNMKVPSIADVDAGVVEAYLAANLRASEFAAKYIWNDGAETAIALNELTFTATAGENNTWNVAVAEAKGLLSATIVVTLEEVTLTTITGSVTVQDRTGEVADDFTDAIPVGAVVTAMPYSDDAMGNVVGTVDEFAAVATIVDADGNFTLEVDPGHYLVTIAHTKYINYCGDIFMTRTIMDEEAVYDVTLNDIGENYDIGTAELRYAYMGDINVDGTVNDDDYGLFTGFFGSVIPGLAD